MKNIFFRIVVLVGILFSCSRKVTQPSTIPIRYDGHLNLDVKIQDKIIGHFVFDTGWSGICLDSLFCKKNGLGNNILDKEIKMSGIGNETSTAKLITDTLRYEFNSNNYRCHSTLTLMFNLKSAFGKKIDGIAGIQTFAQKPYMIDYVFQKIIFTDSVKGFESVNAEFEDNKIYLPLTVTLKNKKKLHGKFLLDTGSDQSILNSHLFNTDGIYNSTYKKKFFAKGGVGGDSNGYFLPVAETSLGKYKLKNVIMTISSDTLGTLSDSNYLGVIGNDLLDDFNIIFDHQKEKIWVKPNKNFNKNKKRLFRGISFQAIGDKWIVAGIVEETEAFRFGIRKNDQILEINNIPVEQIDRDKYVNNLKANDVLNLKIKRDGVEKEIKFKLNVFLKCKFK
ncbi:PDZ domain-containing protein [Flavobacterium sp.]|jgi:hypothetical protein|uniref:PDZ domain-containing protein n=1 Tax=Flavobacterium sp. TaxID=239 RepID=UPI0022C8F545|nr:PDZ domain-containing protein [Flavobacterium sp.]MCZ8169291.1 aspartyl protease family protein [Flavobacterium sp.]